MKANSKLSFLRRNLKGCPEKLRETAYFALVRSFLEYSATVWHPHQKYNANKLEMVQCRAARFVKGRYGMYESVTQILEELTWVPLSKRRENARLILFHKIINNLAMVPHSFLEKADGRTRKKHKLSFRHIGYNVDPYGQSFFPKCIGVRGMALLKKLQRPTLWIYLSLNWHIRPHADLSAIIFVKDY